MKFKIAVSLLLVAALGIVACKKTESDTPSLPSIYGLSFNAPATYVAIGSKLSFTADVSSLYTSDETDIAEITVGVCWQLDSGQKDTTTKNTALENPAKVLTIEEEGEHTLYCYAFDMDGNFYSSSYYSTFTAVNPETAVSGLEGDATVVLDGQTYFALTAGGKTWTGNNLYLPGKGESWKNSPVMDKGMGRLYSWEEAVAVCPAGWHLPTEAEFNASFTDPVKGKIVSSDLKVNATLLGEPLWPFRPDIQITNSFGFNAIPAGYIDLLDLYNTYGHSDEYAFFWTADEKDGMGTYLYLFKKDEEVRKGYGDKKTLLLSVRCVKD